MIRARAGVGYALAEATDEGHCGLEGEQLLTMAAKLLEVPAAIIEGALELELQDGEVVGDTVDEMPCIFLAGLHRAECAIAGRLRTFASGSLSWPAIDADKVIPSSRARRASLSPRASAVRPIDGGGATVAIALSSGLPFIRGTFRAS